MLPLLLASNVGVSLSSSSIHACDKKEVEEEEAVGSRKPLTLSQSQKLCREHFNVFSTRAMDGGTGRTHIVCVYKDPNGHALDKNLQIAGHVLPGAKCKPDFRSAWLSVQKSLPVDFWF